MEGMIEKNPVLWGKLRKRFSIDEDTGCWVWDRVASNGYGISNIAKNRQVAHRAVWMFFYGAVPSGMDLDHLCRNRLCVNPKHLEPVTRSENIRRGFVARGCKNGHPYNEKDFSTLMLKNGRFERRCKKCHVARNKASYNRVKSL